VKSVALALAACAGCASYRLLPLPAEPGAMPVRYEKTRLFFHSLEEDGALSRVFAGPSAILATVAQPERGVFASSDNGATWTFARVAPFDAVLFGERRIFAEASGRVLHSDDQGRTWEGGAPGDEPVDAIALGPAGTLYAGARGRLYTSADGGNTFRALAPQFPAKSWRVRSMVAVPGRIFVSIRGEPAEPQSQQARFQALLGYASAEAVSALELADSRDASARAWQWGTPGDGVYVSRDGGATFGKTGLLLDAWLSWEGGMLYAVAADPLLQAAALVRRYPDLAAAAERHLNGDRSAGATLRAACAFPGRDQLLGGPIASAPIFRSADSGATWSRVVDPPARLVVALRQEVERESWEPPAPPAQRRQQRAAVRPLAPESARGGGGGRAARGSRPGQRPEGAAQNASSQTMLSFVDPARLLAHFNSGLQLTGFSGGLAYLPTEAYWDALVAALAAESEAEGEISLGPGLPDFPKGAAFEVLREGRSGWERIEAGPPRAPPGIVAYPESIAGAGGQAFFVLAGRGRRGEAWRTGWRLATP
jgi:hypothetical protein